MITWCRAAWPGYPSPPLRVPRCCGPVPDRTGWPAGLRGQRPRLPQPLSRSKRHSGHTPCPASPRFLSPIGKFTTNTTIVTKNPFLLRRHTQFLTSIFLPTSSVFATKLKLKLLDFPGHSLILSSPEDTTHHWLYSYTCTHIHKLSILKKFPNFAKAAQITIAWQKDQASLFEGE